MAPQKTMPLAAPTRAASPAETFAVVSGYRTIATTPIAARTNGTTLSTSRFPRDTDRHASIWATSPAATTR